MGETLARLHAEHLRRQQKFYPPRRVRYALRRIRIIDREPEALPVPVKIVNSGGLTVKHIAASVAAYYGIDQRALTVRIRTPSIARPRMVAMYLAREMVRIDGAPISFSRIGREFYRDHTTVIHACNVTRERMAANSVVAADVAAIRNAIVGAHRPEAGA